jgi:hypothetical protein
MRMDFTAAALASPATPLGVRAGAARTAQEVVALGKMTVYGKVVDELNKQRKEKRAFSTMQAFQQAARTVDDTELVPSTPPPPPLALLVGLLLLLLLLLLELCMTRLFPPSLLTCLRLQRRKEVADCWDLLGRVVSEPEQGASAVALPEAVYERTYREEPEALSRKFLAGAKQFLEKQLRCLSLSLSLSSVSCHG